MRDRRTGLRWVGAAATPWAVAAGLLVSFTAAAGHDPGGGVSVAPFGRLDGALVPATRLLARGAPALRLPPGAVEARLSIDLFSAGEDPPVGETPRADAKRAAPGDPFVERGRKGDPDPALRPSLSRRAGEVAAASLGRLLFTAERGLPPAPLVAAPGPDPEAEPAFEPWSPTDPTRTVIASSVQSPAAAAQGSTGAARSSLGNGATPTVARAVALSSTTPAPADATPVEIAAAPVSLSGPFTRIDRSGRALAALPVDPAEKPRYADLVVPENLDREQRCLAEAVYFEARSEPEEGQAAALPVLRLRRRLPEPAPPPRLPVHLRLRGQEPAHHRRSVLARRHPHRQGGAGGPDLPCGGRRLDPLPRGLRQAVLVATAEEDGRDRPAHLLQAEARADVRAPAHASR
jgi:hypothetical protein